MVQEKSLPKTSIYSSKILFEQVDTRNKKRMAQMLKRKTALSTKNKLPKSIYNELSPKEPSTIPKIDDSNDLSFINIIRDKENNNINNIINNNLNNNNQVIIDIKMESEEVINKNKEKEEKDVKSPINNNAVKIDKSSGVSNIVNENNNYYNNSSTNNSNNNSMLYKDSQEKEVNISNLDNDSIDEIILNKEDEENTHKIRTSNLFDYDKDDDNIINKEENKLKEENEFALKYLSSSSDSFIQLDNNLVARAKAQGGDMTDSYLQALFPQLNLDNSKSLKNKNYEVIDIIKEEKEVESPFRDKNNKDTIQENEDNNGSIDINLNVSIDNSFSDFSKKAQSKSNYILYKKNNKSKTKTKINKNIQNSLNNIKYKGNLSFKNTEKILKKNNTMSKFIINNKDNNKNNIKSKNLKNSSSLTNIKMNKDKKINKNNNSFFYSSFSSNLYNKKKLEEKLKNEDLNDSSICNYINNINNPKNIKIRKINSHYLKNINNYQKYKNLNPKNKKVKRNNIEEFNLSNFNINTDEINNLNSISLTKRNYFINDIICNYYNSIDISKKRNILPSRHFTKRFFDNPSLKINIINNNININISKDILPKYKNINLNRNNSFIKRRSKVNHRQNLSSVYSTKNTLKLNTKKQNYTSKYGPMKSASKLTFQKIKKNIISNQDHPLIRSQTAKKLKNINTNNESTILNTTSYIRNNKKNNNNIGNNSNNKKNKFKSFYKKIDYSYVKPKVETGLSETMLKKLLNNNKKLSRNITNKNIETEKKQSLIKRCKITMNKTIDNFKSMASNIKRKLFKGGNKENNNNINDDYTILSCRNNKKIDKNNE